MKIDDLVDDLDRLAPVCECASRRCGARHHSTGKLVRALWFLSDRDSPDNFDLGDVEQVCGNCLNRRTSSSNRRMRSRRIGDVLSTDSQAEGETTILVELSERDTAQILAALRNWQTDAENEDLVEAFAGHFEEHEPLSDDEIDALCERLNFADGQVVKGAAY